MIDRADSYTDCADTIKVRLTQDLNGFIDDLERDAINRRQHLALAEVLELAEDIAYVALDEQAVRLVHLGMQMTPAARRVLSRVISVVDPQLEALALEVYRRLGLRLRLSMMLADLVPSLPSAPVERTLPQDKSQCA